MTTTSTAAVKKEVPGNGKSDMKVLPEVKSAPEKKPEETARPKEMTLDERIFHVEKLKALVEKRVHMVDTRKDLELFQLASSDFNCRMDLLDNKGNKFSTTNTIGIKKVIEFLKDAFDKSITDVENQIRF